MSTTVYSCVHGAANACHGSTKSPSGKRKSYWPHFDNCVEHCGGCEILRFDSVSDEVAEKAVNDRYDTHEEFSKLRENSDGYEIVYSEGETIS